MRFKIILPFAVLSLFLAGCFHVSSDKTADDTATTPNGSTTGQAVTVEMTAQGFVPANLEVTAGTAVEFVNKDTEMHWPASGVHPTHQVCADFDSLKGVESGKSYSYTFKTAKTCPYHDHINPGLKGTIVVK